MQSSVLVLPTSAEIETLKEMRTNEYMKTMNWLNDYREKYEIIFLESVATKNSFIEKYFPVYYSCNHNPRFQNKGANLGNSLSNFFNNNKVKQDLVLQFTGRYNFIDGYFFSIIENNPNYDFYGKWFENENQYFTGAFAMKTKHMMNWLNSTDWNHLNDAMINIEKSIREYVVSKNLKAYHVDKINIECNIFGNGQHLDKRII